MKFNLEETKLLIQILKHNLETINLIEVNKKITYQNLIEKLDKGEYVKGRLLNFLYTEIISSNLKFDDLINLEIENLIKKIKFKATPR